MQTDLFGQAGGECASLFLSSKPLADRDELLWCEVLQVDVEVEVERDGILCTEEMSGRRPSPRYHTHDRPVLHPLKQTMYHSSLVAQAVEVTATANFTLNGRYFQPNSPKMHQFW